MILSIFVNHYFVNLSKGRQTVNRERNEKLYNGVNVGQQAKKPNELLLK